MTSQKSKAGYGFEVKVILVAVGMALAIFALNYLGIM